MSAVAERVADQGGGAGGVDLALRGVHVGADMSEQLEKRWIQVPVVDGDVMVRRDGTMQVLEDEVNTREAARLIGCSIRHVQAMCDEGMIAEGDWRRLPSCDRVGQYRIKRDAVLRIGESRKQKAEGRKRWPDTKSAGQGEPGRR